LRRNPRFGRRQNANRGGKIMVAQTLGQCSNLVLETNKVETLNRAKENKIGDGRETKTTKWESEAVSKTGNTRL
jgi:hypothetical protein